MVWHPSVIPRRTMFEPKENDEERSMLSHWSSKFSHHASVSLPVVDRRDGVCPKKVSKAFSDCFPVSSFSVVLVLRLQITSAFKTVTNEEKKKSEWQSTWSEQRLLIERWREQWCRGWRQGMSWEEKCIMLIQWMKSGECQDRNESIHRTMKEEGLGRF